MVNIDILNLEWPHSDRDLHIVTPILVFLNVKYDLQFKTKSILNGYYYLQKYKPRLLLISNFAGAKINHNLVKLAYNMGIKVVTLISEGNVKKNALDQFLWGWNSDKLLYVDKMLLWSERSKKIFTVKYPELEKKMITTGGTGFDRYKLLSFIKKSEFLNKENISYKKIVGIAAWGFCRLYNEYYKANEKYYLKAFGQEQIDMHRNDLLQLQRIYKKLIKNNKDTLFILRYHPGTIDYVKNEFYKLEKYNNVFISSKYKNNQYKISDLINISDLWIGYETTTALESWLLNKQTFLINPTRSDFVRENVHKGSPIVKTFNEAQSLIDEFFKSDTIRKFEKLEQSRDEIIKDVIEYSDGKSYIRASKEIIKVLDQPDRKIKINTFLYREMLKQLSKLILSKTFMKNRWPELNYTKDFAMPYQERYDQAIND